MKSPSLAQLILLASCLGVSATACGDDGKPAPSKKGTGGAGAGGRTGTGGVPSSSGGLTGMSGLAGQVGAGGTSGLAGSGGLGGSGGLDAAAGSAGTAGTAGGDPLAGTGGVGSVCDVASLQVFSRSDTDQSWDDNDFNTVTLTAGCPVIADVVWPHEADWQDADPSEANQEPVHFTLDAYSSADLTGKQLNLTIELTGDEQGPNGAPGGYVVSLVSVSTYERVVVVPSAGASGTGGMDAGSSGAGGAASGMSGAAGNTGGRGGGGVGGRGAAGTAGSSAGLSGAGGVSGAGGLSGAGGVIDAGGMSGAGGVMTVTETGYTEAVSPVSSQRTLYQVGDRTNVTFALPNKTDAVDSYNPMTAIKINVRITSLHLAPETEDGAGGAGGEGGNGESGADGGPLPPAHDYLTSQFAITRFSVSDVTP